MKSRWKALLYKGSKFKSKEMIFWNENAHLLKLKSLTLHWVIHPKAFMKLLLKNTLEAKFEWFLIFWINIKLHLTAGVNFWLLRHWFQFPANPTNDCAILNPPAYLLKASFQKAWTSRAPQFSNLELACFDQEGSIATDITIQPPFCPIQPEKKTVMELLCIEIEINSFINKYAPRNIAWKSFETSSYIMKTCEEGKENLWQ